MKRLLAAATATALSLMAAGAMAADMPVKAVKAAAPVAVWNWTGFYVGANGGYGWDDESVNFTFDPVFFGGALPLATWRAGSRRLPGAVWLVDRLATIGG